MKYDIILLDADETLMDFPDAEHQALVRTFGDHQLTLTPSIDPQAAIVHPLCTAVRYSWHHRHRQRELQPGIPV